LQTFPFWVRIARDQISYLINVVESRSVPTQAQIAQSPVPVQAIFVTASAPLPSDLSEPLQLILDQLPQLIDCDASAVLVISGEQPEVPVSLGLLGPSSNGRLRFDAPLAPEFDRLIQAGQPLVMRDASQAGPLAELARANGLHASILAPMRYGGRAVGALLVFKQSPGAYGDRDARAAMAVANQLALAIENARLYAETRRRAQQLEAASEVSRRVTSILDMDPLLAQIAGLIHSKLRHDHTNLFLVEGRTNEIVLRECIGEADEALRRVGLRLQIGKEGIIGWVAAAGQPLLCNDVSQEPRYLPHELLNRTQSELAVPLRVGDVVVGVLDVQSNHRDAFHPDDLTALQVLADQVAIAIENAHLFQETRRQFETMRALHEISLTITTEMAADNALSAILKQAAHLLAAKAASLALLDVEAQVVRLTAIHNLPEWYCGTVLALGEGVAGHVVATGEALVVNDYQRSPRGAALFKAADLDAIVSVPLRWENQVFGALNVIDRSDRRPFNQEDVQLLRLFGDLASIALKNAELYAELRQAGEELERKVEKRTEQLAGARAELARKAEELQRLLAITVRVQEEERSRIARDLHDSSNQLLAGTLYELQAAQESIASQRPHVALQKLEIAKGLLRRIDAENRQIITGLRPPILDAQGLVPALKWQAEDFQRHQGVRCTVHVSGAVARLAPEAELAVFRIVQEALNNVAAHARAGYVRLRIEFLARQVRVKIHDDGVGFDPRLVRHESTRGMGLIGIQERAQSIGGEVRISSSPDQGTQVVLVAPLPAAGSAGVSA
jgi:signal transduction histidine kinase